MARLSRVARLSEDITPLLLPSHYTKEDRLNLAVEAMRESGYLADGRTVLSTRSAALLYGVPPSTLNTRFTGKATSREKAHVQQQALSPDQEEVLIRFIRETSWRGIPSTKQSIRNSASQICGGYIGQNWVDRFLDRHPDVKRKVTQPLEACRAKALNRHNVDDFFDKLIDIITHHDIPPENIYNMDEKGVQLGQGGKVLAIVDRELKTAYQIEEGSREMVTVIETVCADGSALDPMVIFPLKRHDLACKKDNDCHAR
jgi:Tc5 transposase DNA-binding domain/helix-turn-helix, Psq domain